MVPIQNLLTNILPQTYSLLSNYQNYAQMCLSNLNTCSACRNHIKPSKNVEVKKKFLRKNSILSYIARWDKLTAFKGNECNIALLIIENSEDSLNERNV